MNGRKVRFKVAWQTYRVGDVIEPNGTLRDWLIDNGYVVPLDDEKPAERLTKRSSKRK